MLNLSSTEAGGGAVARYVTVRMYASTNLYELVIYGKHVDPQPAPAPVQSDLGYERSLPCSRSFFIFH